MQFTPAFVWCCTLVLGRKTSNDLVDGQNCLNRFIMAAIVITVSKTMIMFRRSFYLKSIQTFGSHAQTKNCTVIPNKQEDIAHSTLIQLICQFVDHAQNLRFSYKYFISRRGNCQPGGLQNLCKSASFCDGQPRVGEGWGQPDVQQLSAVRSPQRRKNTLQASDLSVTSTAKKCVLCCHIVTFILFPHRN